MPEGILISARELRKKQTDAEVLMWEILRDRRFLNFKFRRQHPIPPFIIDFYCYEVKLAVELDGSQHLTEEGIRKDNERTKILEDRGIRVIRFRNREILDNIGCVLQKIHDSIHPLPLGEGRGEGKYKAKATRP